MHRGRHRAIANSSDVGLAVFGPSILLRTFVLPVMSKISVQRGIDAGSIDGSCASFYSYDIYLRSFLQRLTVIMDRAVIDDINWFKSFDKAWCWIWFKFNKLLWWSLLLLDQWFKFSYRDTKDRISINQIVYFCEMQYIYYIFYIITNFVKRHMQIKWSKLFCKCRWYFKLYIKVYFFT